MSKLDVGKHINAEDFDEETNEADEVEVLEDNEDAE